MNKSEVACDDQLLHAMLQERLPAEQSDSLLSHVESCRRCQSRINQIAGSDDEWKMASDALAEDHDSPELVFTQSATSIEWSDSIVKHLLAPPSHPEMLGRLGRYEVERLIGVGGAGVVFKAFDSELNRPVAIKVLAPHFAGFGSARKRFAREARAAAAVVHQHVVPIHNVETERECPFLVMHYVAGESLQARIDRGGPLELRETLRIALQVSAGLAAAHDQGLVHRDIKPSNILMEDDTVDRALITDFGLARATDDASLTRSGTHLGTPQYMSPEQARGETADQQSDLFSFGSTLYTLCVGHPPFRAETPYAVMRRISDEEPTPIRERNPEVPTWLCVLIEKLMAKRKEDRFQSAQQVNGLLKVCLNHVQQPSSVGLPRELTGPKCDTPRRSLRVAFLTALLCLFVGLIYLIQTATNDKLIQTVLFENQDGDAEPSGNAAAKFNPANRPDREILGHGYTRGDGKIFFNGMAHAESLPLDLRFISIGLGAPLAKNIDAASFVALSEQYSKDRNKVYLKWVGQHRFVMLELPNTDPGSFEALGYNLARDKNHVWWSHDVIANADPRSVQVLNPGFVWKDAQRVWYQRAPIKGADAKTFKHLNHAFYRDANRIYWSMTPIKEADLDSFRTFSNASPYAADKNHVYMGTKTVAGLDPETFAVVHEQVYKDKNGVYVNGKPVRGARPGSVRKLADLDDHLSALITDGTSHYAFLPAWGEVYQVELQDSSIRVSREIFEGQGDSRQKTGETSVRLTADGWQDLKAPAKYKQHEAGVFSTFKPHFQKSWEVLSGEMVKIASTPYLTDIASSPGGNGYNLPDEHDYPLLRSYRATQRDFDVILRKWLKSNPDIQKQVDNGGSPDIAELFAIELFGYRESGLTKAELTRGMAISTKLATQSYAVQARRLRMPMPELPLLRDELIRQAALLLPQDGFAEEQKRLSAAEQQIDPRIDVWRKHYPGFLWLEPADAKKLTGNVASKASKERLADLADLVRKIEGRKIELSKLSKQLLAEYRSGSLNVVQVELLTHLLTAEQKAHEASSAD